MNKWVKKCRKGADKVISVITAIMIYFREKEGIYERKTEGWGPWRRLVISIRPCLNTVTQSHRDISHENSSRINKSTAWWVCVCFYTTFLSIKASQVSVIPAYFISYVQINYFFVRSWLHVTRYWWLRDVIKTRLLSPYNMPWKIDFPFLNLTHTHRMKSTFAIQGRNCCVQQETYWSNLIRVIIMRKTQLMRSYQ